jgi:Uma2 family endonuclease
MINVEVSAVMDEMTQIQQALARLSIDKRENIADWLRKLIDAQPQGYAVAEPRAANAAGQSPFMTVEEYLDFEENSPIRHEYVNGAIYAMSGVSVAHARIARELVMTVGGHLRGGPCELFSTDLKLLIRTDTDEVIYYPDMMVACQRGDWGSNYVRNPKLVAEILSPSTQHIDRREKAMTYRRIPSVEEFVLLAQDEHKVIVQRRAEHWRPQSYSGPEATVEFRSIGLSVPLAQIYAGTL